MHTLLITISDACGGPVTQRRVPSRLWVFPASAPRGESVTSNEVAPPTRGLFPSAPLFLSPFSVRRRVGYDPLHRFYSACVTERPVREKCRLRAGQHMGVAPCLRNPAKVTAMVLEINDEN